MSSQLNVMFPYTLRIIICLGQNAQPILRWFGSPFWLAFCSMLFKFNCWHGRIDSSALVSHPCIASLFRWLHYHCPPLPSLVGMFAQLKYRASSLQTARPASLSGEVWRPCNSACSIGIWTGFCQSSCPPASRQTIGLAGPDQLVPSTEV